MVMGFIQGPFDRLFIAEIDRNRMRLGAQPPGDRLRAFTIDVRDGDAGAFGHEPFSRGRPDSARSASNESHFVSKPLHPNLPILLTDPRSEEHTSELQSLMRTSYAVF